MCGPCENSRFKVFEGGSRVRSGFLLEEAVHSLCCSPYHALGTLQVAFPRL